MKKILSLALVAFTAISFIAAQPQKMTYQTVVRNSNFELVVNQQVGVRVSILEDSVNGPMIYRETHTPTTNVNGLITIMIGEGLHPYTNTLDDVNWDRHTHYLSVEIDPAGGTNYTIFGAQQLVSVPYAFYSESARYVDTAIYAVNATVATYADTSRISNFADTTRVADYAHNSGNAVTANYATSAGTATTATSALYADSTRISNHAIVSNSATYADSTLISNHALTAGAANTANSANTAIYADTAMFLMNAQNSDTAKFAYHSDTAVYSNTSNIATYADSTKVSDFAHNSDTAKFSYHSDTTNYALNSGSANYANEANMSNYADSARVSNSANYADTTRVADYAHNSGNAVTANYATSAGTATTATSALYADSTRISNHAITSTTANMANYADSSDYNHLVNRPLGNNTGDILYWNTKDSSWHVLPVGNSGETLVLDTNNVPKWNAPTIVTLPTVTTDSVINVTSDGATAVGTISSNGGSVFVFSGICWSTFHNPTTADNHTIDGSSVGSFISKLSALVAGTNYYVRAFATNSAGTNYGNEVVFTTTALPPTVTTSSVGGITGTGAIS